MNINKEAAQLALEFEKLQSDKTLSFDGYWEAVNNLILIFSELICREQRESDINTINLKFNRVGDIMQAINNTPLLTDNAKQK